MLKSLGIKNFKSLLDHSLELGRLNIFIGENGSGKTNILEAVATASAALWHRLSIEELSARGVRIAKPSITISSFLKTRPAQAIELALSFDAPDKGQSRMGLTLSCEDTDDINATWEVKSYSLSTDIAKELAQALNEQIKALDETGGLTAGEPDIRFPGTLMGGLPQPGRHLESFCIYNLNPLALRGIQNTSLRAPLGINGENLDVLLATFSARQFRELTRYSKLIPWFDKLILDMEDELKLEGHKLGRSTSRLYFRDRFMRRGNNIFSAENANEGILHILFYLALFLSDRTPPIFGIDNIETSLNPQLCRELMKALASLAKAHDKQALVTTHNPAVLDGLNLHDDDQRLFVVYRDDQGYTVTKRIKLKPDTGESKYKLSELWMRGHLGGLPKTF